MHTNTGHTDIGSMIDRLTAWLGARHPEARDIRFPKVEPPGQGYSNETWMIDLVWKRNGAEERHALVLRLQPSAAGLFPEYDLSLQYRCMEHLAGTDVPVPKLFGYAGADSPLGVPFYLMERLPGRVVMENPLYHLEGWLHEMAPAAQRTLWLAGLETIARIARLDWQALGFSFLDRRGPRQSHLDEQLTGQRRFLGWVEAQSEPYPHLRQALEWLEASRPQEEVVGLCWGDSKIGNMLFEGERCTGLLDWEMARLGDPVDDLAWYITLDRALSEGYGVPRLPGFPPRAESVAHWEKTSGRPARHLPYYEVLGAFKFALIMARLGHLYAERGMVPREMRMDLNNGGAALLRIVAQEQGLPFA